jgi:hypothetical protein
MPFRSVPPSGFFSPDDLAFLQSVYDEACVGINSVDDVTMREIATTLLTVYEHGIRERPRLLAIARQVLVRRTA